MLYGVQYGRFFGCDPYYIIIIIWVWATWNNILLYLFFEIYYFFYFYQSVVSYWPKVQFAILVASFSVKSISFEIGMIFVLPSFSFFFTAPSSLFFLSFFLQHFLQTMVNRKITKGMTLMTIKNVSIASTAAFNSSGRSFRKALVADSTYPVSNVSASAKLVANARTSADGDKYGVCRSNSMA